MFTHRISPPLLTPTFGGLGPESDPVQVLGAETIDHQVAANWHFASSSPSAGLSLGLLPHQPALNMSGLSFDLSLLPSLFSPPLVALQSPWMIPSMLMLHLPSLD